VRAPWSAEYPFPDAASRRRSQVTIVNERERSLLAASQKAARAAHRLQVAFKRAAAHEGSTLGRRLRRIGLDAEEAATKECAALQPAGDLLAKQIGRGRAEIDAEAAEAVSAVRLEVNRLAAEWSNSLAASSRGAREVQAHTLLEHQQAHREARAARRVVDNSAEQTRRVAISSRESSLTQLTTNLEKEIEGLAGWLAKRIEAANAAAQAAPAAGALSAPVDLSVAATRFEGEVSDLRGRIEAQRVKMGELHTQLFVARAKGTATRQVAEVMRAVEDRCEEMMASAAAVGDDAAGSLRCALEGLLAEVGRQHDASLAQTAVDADAYERALVAPSVRDAPKHEELLRQLEHELSLQMQLSLSRPNEWFELLGRKLKLDEHEVAEWRERAAVGTARHTEELSALEARAAEEVAAEEGLQAAREGALVADASAAVHRMAHERRERLRELPMPELVSVIREAVEKTARSGETMALERRRAAFERLDLSRPKLPAPAVVGARPKGSGGGAAAHAQGESLDGRRHPSRRTGTADVAADEAEGFVTGAESELLLRLRETFHQLAAEATATQPYAAAASSLQLDWAEEAAEGKHGLPALETRQLRDLEAELATSLRETIREEHLEFAAKVKALAEEREELRAAASAAPPQSPTKALDSAPPVRKAEARVTAARAELAPITASELNRSLGSPTRALVSANAPKRRAFDEALEEQRRVSREAVRALIAEREDGAAASGALRATALEARTDAARSELDKGNREFSAKLDEKITAARLRLEPARKRLAASKRSCAAELLAGLVEESEEASLGLVRYNLKAKEAKEAAWARRVEALVRAHEAEAAELAATRASLLEHHSHQGGWADGFVPTLVAVGALGEPPAPPPPFPPSKPAREITDELRDLNLPEGIDEPRLPRLSSNPLPTASARARAAFEERPLLLSALAPRSIPAAKPRPPAPLEPVDVNAVLEELGTALQLDGSDKGGGAHGGAWVWERASLERARALHAPLSRARAPRAPSLPPEEDLSPEALRAAAVKAATTAEGETEDAKLAREIAQLERHVEQRAAQKRALEAQAAERVKAQRFAQLAAARERAEAELTQAQQAFEREEYSMQELTAQAKAMAVARIQDRMRAEAAANGGVAARIWSEALLRRQSEEARSHGRRLRHEAHAAASSTLGERGEASKEQLASMRELMATLSAIAEEH
jgi:hypothetical protein